MSPCTPCGRTCSAGTRNKTAAPIFGIHQSNYDAIEASNIGLDIRILSKCYQLLNRIESYIIFAITIVIHKSRDVIDTQRSSEFVAK